MIKKPRVLVGVVVYNEEDKIIFLLEKFKKLKIKYETKLLFLDDGSTDNSVKIIRRFIKKHQINNAEVLLNKTNRGVGFQIRKAVHFGINNQFDIGVIMAGNGKDTPLEIPVLIDPITKEGYDYIQGSRFLKGGSFKNLPFLRKNMILGFTLLMSLFTGFKCTDSSNGFRAYKLSIFKDKRINIDQPWLDRYELETYLHYKVITLGYKIKEVAVSKDYLPNIKRYSKIRPFIDWWRMVRPIFLLKLRLKD